MKKIVLVALWLFAAAPILVGQQFNFSFNPPKNFRYEYSSEMSQEIRQNVMGQDINTTAKMNTTFDMSVLEKTKDGVKMDYVYKAVSYGVANPYMTLAYDSANPEENPSPGNKIMGKALGSLIEKHFEVDYANDGTVKAVTGMDVILNDIVSAFEDSIQAAVMKESLAQQLTNEAMKKTLEQSMKVYPSRKVRIGDSWDIEQQIDIANISLKVKSTYQLVNVRKKIGIVHATSVIEDAEGTPVGEQVGESEFDMKSGMVLKSLIRQQIKKTISVQDMEIPMDVSSEIKIYTKL